MKDKVFLAGSDIGLINILREKLSFTDIEVINNPIILYRRIKKEKPRFLILESVLPQWDWNGYMISKLVKYDKRLSDIKVILISDKREKDAEQMAKEVKADFHFLKGKPIEKIIEEMKKNA
jgi:PleD family two-component response regulator